MEFFLTFDTSKKKGGFYVENDILEPQDFVHKICVHFLGPNWYIVDPVGQKQANKIILDTIIKRYPSGKFRRIQKK